MARRVAGTSDAQAGLHDLPGPPVGAVPLAGSGRRFAPVSVEPPSPAKVSSRHPVQAAAPKAYTVLSCHN
ncbi:hypothetical protein [Streptomyces griseosporeus]|uniref:hypothetical protein n=1 Tax=Streptomyces griseosporeus TaxID=1910 RepID=UPI0036F7B83D